MGAVPGPVAPAPGPGVRAGTDPRGTPAGGSGGLRAGGAGAAGEGGAARG